MCFLKSSILSRFLNLFETIFHIRLLLKEIDWAPYLEVSVSGNFKNCLLRRSNRVFFKSKKIFSWLMDLNYLSFIFQLLSYVCYFHKHSRSYLLIADNRNSHLPFRRRVRLCILFIWLFEVLLHNIQIKEQYLNADII